MSISLNNVVRVSIAGPSKGLPVVNTSALAILTHDSTPRSWGPNQEFKLYLEAQGVAKDFGSDSVTYKLAETVFSQKATPLKGGGHLLVIPRKARVPASSASVTSHTAVDLTSLTAEDYRFRVWDDGASVKDITFGPIDTTSVESVETALNSHFGDQSNDLKFTVRGDLTRAYIVVTTEATGDRSEIQLGALPEREVGTDLALALNLLDSDNEGVSKGVPEGLESIKNTILRTVGKIPYFAVIHTEIMDDDSLLETASTVQSLNLLQFVASPSPESLRASDERNEGGVFTQILKKGYTKTRTLFYGSENEIDALTFAAGYASILLSLNFNNPGSALTMNLKDFTGLGADASIDDDLFEKCKKAGVDVLASIGIPKIFSNGANLYADQVYTRLALQVDLQIAGINFLSTTNTKIPQTEEGMVGLKGAYSSVLQRYVLAGVYAPGEWKSSTVFSPDGDDHRRNVSEWGYYVYSPPINQQSTEMRAVRIAPVVQIAAKEAGAIHSSEVVVEVRP